MPNKENIDINKENTNINVMSKVPTKEKTLPLEEKKKDMPIEKEIASSKIPSNDTEVDKVITHLRGA